MALSLFPKNLLKVAEWFGFHSDRNEGVAQLIASTNSGSISSPMVSIFCFCDFVLSACL